MEAQFACRRITTQRTKFDHVVSSLSPEFATEVRDLLLKLPVDNPYDVLKEQLVRRTAASEQRKLQQLFTAEELGDRKPTQLLRKMQLLGDRQTSDRPGVTDGSFLKELFLQRLPYNVSASTLTTALVGDSSVIVSSASGSPMLGVRCAATSKTRGVYL